MHRFKQPRWVFGGAVLLTLGVMLARFVQLGSFIVAGDGLGFFLPAASLAVDGNHVIADELTAMKEAGRWALPVQRVGRQSPGLTYVLMPTWVVGEAAAAVAGAARTEGIAWPHELAWALGSFALGWLGLAAAGRVAADVATAGTAAWAVVLAAAGGPLGYYLVLEPGMSHAVSAAAVSAVVAVWWLKPWATRWRWALVLAAVLMLATLVRPQNALWAGLVAARWVLPVERTPRGAGMAARSLVVLLAVPVAMGLVFLHDAAQAASLGAAEASNALLGQAADNRADHGLHLSRPAILNVLILGQRPLLLWHPLVGLAGVGLMALALRRPALGVPLLLGTAAQLYLIASWFSGWQGASVGLRMMAGCTVAFAAGLAVVLDAAARRPGGLRLVGVGTMLCLAWSAALTLGYMTGRIPASEPFLIGGTDRYADDAAAPADDR